MSEASGITLRLEPLELKQLLRLVEGKEVVGLLFGRRASPVTATQVRRYLDDWTRDPVSIETQDPNHLRVLFGSGEWVVLGSTSPLYVGLTRILSERYEQKNERNRRSPLTPHVERHFEIFFGAESISVFDREDAYQRLIEGESVAVEDAFDDGDGDHDNEDTDSVPEGVHLVTTTTKVSLPTKPAPWSWRDAIPAIPVDRYVREVVEGFVVARCRDQRFARCGEASLKRVLVERRPTNETLVPTVPMRSLESWTYDKFTHPFSWPSRPHERMQHPDSYKRLYDTGSFAGILNRSVCSEVYDSDYVWIEDDLCMFWMRSNTISPMWIRLFPFRVDRTGPPGRLLRRWRHWTLVEEVLMPRRVSREWHRYYWYE